MVLLCSSSNQAIIVDINDTTSNTNSNDTNNSDPNNDMNNDIGCSTSINHNSANTSTINNSNSTSTSNIDSILTYYEYYYDCYCNDYDDEVCGAGAAVSDVNGDSRTFRFFCFCAHLMASATKTKV